MDFHAASDRGLLDSPGNKIADGERVTSVLRRSTSFTTMFNRSWFFARLCAGDRLVLELGPAVDATRPRASCADILPGEAQRPPLPKGEGADEVYAVDLKLVKPQLPGPPNFATMVGRQSVGPADDSCPSRLEPDLFK